MKFIEILEELLGDEVVKECGLSLCVMISKDSEELEYIIYEEALKYGFEESILLQENERSEELE
ncbi:MAG: hypothetical protein IPK55_11450 [Streptococcus sp.]|nr:hypothetical protein [Streptococcus sp.]